MSKFIRPLCARSIHLSHLAITASFSLLVIPSALAQALTTADLAQPSTAANAHQPTSSSCDIYHHIDQSNTPINLLNLTQTPNGINIYSDDLALQVANFQPCRAAMPFSDDAQAIARYSDYAESLADIADKRIDELPQGFSFYEQASDKEVAELQALPEQDYFAEEVVQLYLTMAFAHYLGEYVPKDDALAVAYLSKVVEYYQTKKPDWSPLLSYIVAQGIWDDAKHISRNNPIQLQHAEESGLFIISSYLLKQAGHLDTQAKLIADEIESDLDMPIAPSTAEIHQYIEPKLERLKQLAQPHDSQSGSEHAGSYVAISALAQLYERLTAYDADYAKDATYWQQQEYALPQSDISWN